MTGTSVPQITFTTAGVVLPTDDAILTGTIADIDTAFGGGVNPALETPQGQMASSLAAIIADKNAEFAYTVNQVDPKYSSGRFQDAIGRIYFLERKPATSTSVICTIGGIPGTVITAGKFAQDTSGYTYYLVSTVTIGAGSTVSAEFQNVDTGPIACAAGTLSIVYQSVPGWDTITNAADGILGTNEETRAEFEFRRQNSVALNGHGTPQAIYGAVFDVDNVTDVFVIDNKQSPASFTADISATTMTVSAMASGRLIVGSVISGGTVAADTWVTAILTGTGGAGTYTVSVSQTVTSSSLVSMGIVYGDTDYPMTSNSIYIAAVGGTDDDIAAAIWSKLDAGTAMNGNTTVTVSDTSYSVPQPTYDMVFNRISSAAIEFEVNIIDDPDLPADIVTLTKDAIVARFNGTDGTYRERIGGTVYASRYYPAVAGVATAVAIDSILIGRVTATATKVAIGIDEKPTITATDITVNLV